MRTQPCSVEAKSILSRRRKKIEVGAKMIHWRGEGGAGYCLVTPPPPRSSWALAKAEPPTQSPTQPYPPPLGGGVYALHPQSHTSRAELTHKKLQAVGIDRRTL